MLHLHGIAVSQGVAIGEALVLDHEGFHIRRRFVSASEIPRERQRLAEAVVASMAEIERHRDAVRAELGEQYAAIFSAHMQMLDDSKLRDQWDELIEKRHCTSEYAVSQVLRRYAQVFEQLGAGTFQERANDVLDIEKRLLRHLLGTRESHIGPLERPVVVLAHNLTPSETAGLNRRFVKGFVTEIGGPGSHTAIVAEALEIAAVVGTGSFLASVASGDTVIVDGDHGEVILQPDEATLERYRRRVERLQEHAAQLETLRDLPAQTACGTKIELLGNIEFPEEVEHCLERGAEGIGLYRTEFLYLGSTGEPSEEDHMAAYQTVVQSLGGRPIVIRTFDLGADKVSTAPRPRDEPNPFLGLRSIRLSLRNLDLFRRQLRAILRASAEGDVRVMFPLIATVHELRQAKMVLADVMEDLEENGIPFNRRLPIGIMVEVPSTVIMIEHFVREVDFLSIGTNDLIQYTLAVDRGNTEVASLYSAADPAVLRLVAQVVAAADARGVPVDVCGQMSGNPSFTMPLIGMGLRQFSVAPGAIPEVKRVCRRVTVEDCRRVSRRTLEMDSARDIEAYLRRELLRVLPELDNE